MNTLFDYLEETSASEDVLETTKQHIQNNTLDVDDIQAIKDYINDMDKSSFQQTYPIIFDEVIALLKEAKKYEHAFKILDFLYIKASQLSMDASFIDEAMSCTKALAPYISNDTIYLWFMTYGQDFNTSYSYAFLHYLVVYTDNPIHLEYLHEYLKEYLGLLDKQDSLDHVMLLLKLLEKRSYTSKKMIDECKGYFYHEKAIAYMVDKVIKEQDDQQAIYLIKQYIDNRLSCFVKYQIILKELYKRIGDKESYLSQLFLLVSFIAPDNQKLYLELKQQYDEESWKAVEQQLNMFQSA